MIGRNGIRDALLAAVLFGLSAPIAKTLIVDLHPQLLAGLLYLGAGSGLTILGLTRPGMFRPLATLPSKDFPFLAGAIGLGGIVAPFLLMVGLERTSDRAPRCCSILKLSSPH